MFFLIILSCDFHFSDSVVQLTVGQVHAYVYYLLTVKLNNSLRFSTKTEIVLFLLVIFIEDGLLLVPAGLLSRLEMCDDHARQHHNNQN